MPARWLPPIFTWILSWITDIGVHVLIRDGARPSPPSVAHRQCRPKAATKTIPIVFAIGGDSVSFGLVTKKQTSVWLSLSLTQQPHRPGSLPSLRRTLVEDLTGLLRPPQCGPRSARCGHE